MTNIEFNEEEFITNRSQEPGRRSLQKILIASSGGLIQSEKMAEYILLGVAVIALGMSFLFIKSSFSNGAGPSGRTPIPTGTVQPQGFPPSS